MIPGFRIGFGYDVHQLVEGRKFILGGIELLYIKGPLAHSDGDVLIHAICDALLGAAGMGDIGTHFPDTSPEFKDVDSKDLLRKVIRLLAKENYSVVNIDSTVSLEKPKLRDHISKMQEILAAIIGVETTCMSIKATTTEKLGFVGREEGIAAQAVVLLHKK